MLHTNCLEVIWISLKDRKFQKIDKNHNIYSTNEMEGNESNMLNVSTWYVRVIMFLYIFQVHFHNFGQIFRKFKFDGNMVSTTVIPFAFS